MSYCQLSMILLTICISLCSCLPQLFKGYIISNGGLRLKHTTRTVLMLGNVVPIHVRPVPLHDPRILEINNVTKSLHDANFQLSRMKTLSNKLTQTDMWKRIAYDDSLDDNDWSLIFEDDSSLLASVSTCLAEKSLNQVAALATLANDSVFYLGICGPKFQIDSKCQHARALSQSHCSWRSTTFAETWIWFVVARIRRTKRDCCNTL